MFVKKSILYIITIFCISNSIYSQGIIAPKYISDQVEWTNDTITFDTTLTILPTGNLKIGFNSILLFNEGCGIRSFGKLTMIGSDNEPIIVTNLGERIPKVDSSYNGAWSGIDIYGDSTTIDTFRFINCHFSNGVATIAKDENGDGGALWLAKNHFYIIENCIFENNFALNNGGAIYTKKAQLSIKNCSFKSNRCLNGYGGGISLEPGKNKSLIEGSIFLSNMSGGDSTGWNSVSVSRGGAFEVRYPGGWLNVYNNIFANNIASSTIWSSSSKTVIAGNLLVNNWGMGYFLANTYSPDWIFNNTIMNNAGKGLNIFSKNAIIANNYLAGNIRTNVLGGVYTTDLDFYDKDPTFDNVYNNSFRSVTTSLSVINEDLWKFKDNNYIGEYYLNDTSTVVGIEAYGLDYKWSLLNDNLLGGKGNLSTLITDNIPQKDIYGTVRLANGTLDIGAIEVEGDLGNATNENIDGLQVYPTLVNKEIYVRFSSNVSADSKITIMNLNGKIVSIFPLTNGVNTLDLSKLLAGFYILNVHHNRLSQNIKIIKI